VDNIYQLIDDCLCQARAFLNKGDSRAALKALEALAENDFRGVHTAYPEYYMLLRSCQQSLGMDTRGAESQIAETGLSWLEALKKGQKLLNEGKAGESIGYFQRSINGNPGEYGASAALEAARLGIIKAKDTLERQKNKR